MPSESPLSKILRRAGAFLKSTPFLTNGLFALGGLVVVVGRLLGAGPVLQGGAVQGNPWPDVIGLGLINAALVVGIKRRAFARPGMPPLTGRPALILGVILLVVFGFFQITALGYLSLWSRP